jgi:hypothetical protein
MNSDEALLGKINKAVAAANEAEHKVKTAQTELVSRSKAVGELLLEAKKRHPKVADFEKFLKRVDGLKLSRAYDYLRLAGGRVTHEELREEARERKRKSRAKKLPPRSPLLPKPELTGKADNFRDIPHVTESSEISIEQRRAENARLDDGAKGSADYNFDYHFKADDAKGSADYLAEFKDACRHILWKISDRTDQMRALAFVQDTFKRMRAQPKHKRTAA